MRRIFHLNPEAFTLHTRATIFTRRRLLRVRDAVELENAILDTGAQFVGIPINIASHNLGLNMQLIQDAFTHERIPPLLNQELEQSGLRIVTSHSVNGEGRALLFNPNRINDEGLVLLDTEPSIMVEGILIIQGSRLILGMNFLRQFIMIVNGKGRACLLANDSILIGELLLTLGMLLNREELNDILREHQRTGGRKRTGVCAIERGAIDREQLKMALRIQETMEVLPITNNPLP